jgi:hypothetical protein
LLRATGCLSSGRFRPPQGSVDFGATSVELLQYAYLGIHDFARDPEAPRKQLRLVATIQTPSYFMVAVNVKSGIDDLRQIADRKMPVKPVARGGATEPINAAVLEYYGLFQEKLKAFGSWCGRGDSNPHALASASPSSWCVCQFRHFRRGTD